MQFINKKKNNPYHEFTMDEFDFLRDFRRYIKDDNLAKNIFNSNGTDECIINMNDIIKVFNVSNDKIDEFISNFKSEIVRYADYHIQQNLEKSEKTKKSLESIYSEFNGFFDKINKYIKNKDFSDSEDEDTDSDSENDELESYSKNEDTESDSALNKIELEKNLMESFCFYKLNDEKLNEDNLCILNKISKKLYNFKPPHDFYGMIDNSGIKEKVIQDLDEDKDPHENISFYYVIKEENGIENMFINGSGLTVLASGAKEKYFDNKKSYLRFMHIPGKLMSCAFKALRMEYRLKKNITLDLH